METRHARLTEQLGLNAAQQQAAARMLDGVARRRADGLAAIAAGRTDLAALRDVLYSEVAAATAFRSELAASQLAAYETFLGGESAAFAEQVANGEVSRLSALLRLTETQKDAIFTVMARQAVAIPALGDETATTLTEVRTRWEAMQQEEERQLAAILDEEQRKSYQEQAAARRVIFTALLTPRLESAHGAALDPPVTARAVTAAGGDPLTVPVPKALATVLIFSSTSCPIANGYAPEINRLDKEFRPRGVALCMVQTETVLTAEAARQHAAEYQFTGLVLLDPQRTLTKAAGAVTTPEAVLLLPDGTIAYRGRIDDRFPDVGQGWREPRHTELRDALAAVLAGRAVTVPRTEAKGCHIE